jgi:hypothetical protein
VLLPYKSVVTWFQQLTAAHVVCAEWRDEMSWEGGELKHVKFVMLKENTDTQVNL